MNLNWGDATAPTTNPTIGYNSATQVFTVTSHHTYVESGSYAVSVSVGHETANTAQVSDTATVADAPLSWANGAPTATWVSNPTPNPTITTPSGQTNAEGETASL